MIKHDRHAAEIQSDVVQCNGSRRSKLTRAHHPSQLVSAMDSKKLTRGNESHE